MPSDIWFAATSRSGLGHLRRLATIARAVAARDPSRHLCLLTNAEVRGLEPEDIQTFSAIIQADRSAMADCIAQARPAVAVLDTIALPDIWQLPCRQTLVLREAPEAELSRFARPANAPWDQVIIANPESHWMPGAALGPRRATTAVGWIYRHAGLRQVAGQGRPRVLIATGGGGTEESAAELAWIIGRVLAYARFRAGRTFEAIQALGPRAGAAARVMGVDQLVDPGGRLHELFREADVVISTAGYNSVLELATTDTPSLLIPIPRTIDDQAARARAWAGRLGRAFEGDIEEAGLWLATQIDTGRRRTPLDLGPGGEGRAADLILALT